MSSCSRVCNSQLKALPGSPPDPLLWSRWHLTKLDTWPVSRGTRRPLRPRWIRCQWDRVCSLAWQDADPEGLCPASCPRGFHLLFWLLRLTSLLETQPALPLRFSPCRDKVVRGGSGLKDPKGSFLSPLVGASRPPCGPQSLGIHSSDSDPTLGHVRIVGPDPRGHSLMDHGIFRPLLSRSLAPSLLGHGRELEEKSGASGSRSASHTCAQSGLGKSFHFSKPLAFSCFVKGDSNIYLSESFPTKVR